MKSGFLHGLRLEQSEVHPVRPSLQLISEVISPVTDIEMPRVHAAPVMTPMSDHLISGGGKPVDIRILL